MNCKKNQNSILYLTTLGVYLGLLVVGGAAPQVFAHSATTRNFELVDEIEVKDDLDKDPDETHHPRLPANLEKFSAFANAYAEFVLAEYENEREFQKKLEKECPDGCRLSYLRYFPTLAPSLEEFFGVSEYSGRFWWSVAEIGREIEIKYSPTLSEQTELQDAFAKGDRASFSVRRVILQNSIVSINPKNRHFAIVTRLPRASLDPLLAKIAK